MTGESSNKTAVYLTDEEAESFILFRKNQEQLAVILEALKNPITRQITLHVDPTGAIRRMDTATITVFTLTASVDSL